MLQLTCASSFFLVVVTLALYAWRRGRELRRWSAGHAPPTMNEEVARLFELVYLGVALPCVVCFALYMPPFNVPDETAHLRRAALVAQSLRFGLRAENGVVGAELPRWIDDLDHCNSPTPPERPHADAATLRRCSAIEDRHTSNFQALPNTAMYPPVFYLPQALALALGRVVHAAPYTTYYFARLINGLCGVALGWLALRTTRHLHAFVLAWLLLPLTLQQMGSLSLDATLIPAGFFFVAACERILLTQSCAAVTYTAWLALWAALAATKAPLVTFFMLPLATCLHTRVRNWSRTRQLAATGIAALMVLSWLGYVHALHIVLREDLLADAAHHRQVLRHEPRHFLVLVAKTLLGSAQRYLHEAIGALGRMQTVLPRRAMHAGQMALFCGTLHAIVQPWRPRWPIRAAGALALGGGTLLTFVVFYLTWTPAGARKIEGIQGRYLLYLAPPCGLAVVGLLPCRVVRLSTAVLTVLASLAALAYVPWTLFVAHVV